MNKIEAISNGKYSDEIKTLTTKIEELEKRLEILESPNYLRSQWEKANNYPQYAPIQPVTVSGTTIWQGAISETPQIYAQQRLNYEAANAQARHLINQQSMLGIGIQQEQHQ